MSDTATKTRADRWLLIQNSANGRRHRLFTESGTNRVAIADGSGDWPEETDDGVLFVDPKRDIVFRSGGHVTLPLLTEEGRHARTGIDPIDAFRYARQFRMTIRAGACNYVVGLA